MPRKKQELTQDEKYMKEAIRQAKKAEQIMEVPIGCVIVYEDKIIARGYNKRNLKRPLWRMQKSSPSPKRERC